MSLDSVDSTNLEARRRLDAGERPPFWIQSRRQTAGRGRRGRPWSSLDGNLFLTGAVAPAAPAADAAQLSFAGALAVADLLDAHVEPSEVALKWPNDVLLAGDKVSGVLLEAQGQGEGLTVLIGVGVNLAAAPGGATAMAAHLRPGAA
ncbi:MAG: biotin--[acetyl-CoA-carboxylase] ligase, partial [Caulobacterales bacterium]|nr:biotin--[acetyl-CoA-carboxylase] ligase [Caulobacterales bacterium]